VGTPRRVRVVAAVIERDGRYLITQRRPHAAYGLHWEFPGGKVEPGEEDGEALRRELLEELEARVEVGPLLGRSLHSYPEFELDFRVYRCHLLEDRLVPRQVHDLRWVTLEEMEEFPFPPADEGALRDLLRTAPERE